MKLNQAQIEEIQNKFSEMNSKTEFLGLLNLAKSFIHLDKNHPFHLKSLNYYTTLKDNKAYYSFEIPKKKKGEYRTINAPIKGLKEFQTVLNLVLNAVYTPHFAATGFVVGKSIVDNAKLHTNQNYVYNIDLKDFFPSIDKSRVWGRLLVAPFNLGTTPERKHIANAIARLSSIYLIENENIVREVLPQGAPTSPILSNAICERLDKKLTGLSKRFGLTYSRYADDITFSSMHNEYDNNGELDKIYGKNTLFSKELYKIITEQNFRINESKIRLQKRGYKQEVTGLIVNDKVNVSKKYIKQLRHWIYFIERYGLEKAESLFVVKYLEEKGKIEHKPNMVMVLTGKLLYLKMVRGFEDELYLKLQNRFEKAIGKVNAIDEVLNLWEKEGLKIAMNNYYNRYKLVDLSMFMNLSDDQYEEQI